jgi:lysophospholipase L1-like esterase
LNGSGRRRHTIALVAASTAVALAVAEGVVRMLRPAAASIVDYPCFYEPDERFGFRYEPGGTGRVAGHFEIDNTVTLNSLGFHDDEPPAPGESSLVVLAVGDSFTAGLNLPRDAVWTAVLERELRARGFPSAHVVNLGIDGTGTDVHLELVRAYAPTLRPQVVIVAFFANDVDDVLNGRFGRECHRGYVLSYQDELQRAVLARRVDEHLDREVSGWLFDHFYTVRLAVYAQQGPMNLHRLRFVQVRRAELGIDDALHRRRAQQLRQSFADLAAFAAECDCSVVVAPVPPRRELAGSLRVLRRWIGAAALPVVDVVPAMERMLAEDGRTRLDLYWTHDNHLNDYGNELFARALAEANLWH